MWRHQAVCPRCGAGSGWNRDREESVRELEGHLGQKHQLNAPREAIDYTVIRRDQCHYCLEECLDRCTKCEKDYCMVHEGFIHGYCNYCI